MVPHRAGLNVTPRRRYRWGLLGLAAAAAILVGVVAAVVFTYHSLNHDEAVYLQQAALLLDGRLGFRPPVPAAMRPWFFFERAGRLYPKYAPVPAAVFAPGVALGVPRLSLAAVAAANVALVAAVGREAFDARTGLLAGAALLASPLFVVQSAVFLPYAPTFALEALFALAYLRSVGLSSRRWAALAGAAVGLAFFARPYTAVLFAAPFVAHAALGVSRDRATLARHGVVAGVGLAGVALALAYNVAVTGAPLLFPYEAFAPLDGLGFGRRRLLDYAVTYTPALALRSTLRALGALFGRWVAGGPVGAALAAVGAVAALRGVRADRVVDDAPAAARVTLAGLAVTVVVGNAYFWGTYNALGPFGAPGVALADLLGPYYHFDLLLPTAVFGAHGLRTVTARLRRTRTRRVAAWAAVALVLTAGAVSAAAAADTLSRNATVTAEYRAAYAPFADRPLDDALVFLPTPYGPWLNHPFQALRNDPGDADATVYALDVAAAPDAAAAFPDRHTYRYVYRGAWRPTDGRPVDASLEPVRYVTGETVTATVRIRAPDAETLSVRVGGASGQAYYAVPVAPNGTAAVRLVVDGGRARVAGPGVDPQGDPSFAVAARDELVVSAAAPGRFYRARLPVTVHGGTVRAVSPYLENCRVAVHCGGGAPARNGSVTATLSAE
ncbi:MAG: glycosyltransferase family 39 protein [Halobacteriaceae archaeon]